MLQTLHVRPEETLRKVSLDGIVDLFQHVLVKVSTTVDTLHILLELLGTRERETLRNSNPGWYPNIGKTDETGLKAYNGLPNDCRESAPEQFEVKFHENANT